MKVKFRGKPDKVDKVDWPFVPVDPEPGFDADHNRRVIQESVEATDKLLRQKEHEHADAYRERSAATAQYLKSLQMGGKTRDIEKYFGRRYLAYLRGKEVMARIKDQLTVWGKDGKIIRRSEVCDAS